MTGIPIRPDIREQIDARNRAAYADLLLRERIRGLIRDYLAPSPRAAFQVDPPPAGWQRMASAPVPTSGPQTSSRRGARTEADGNQPPPVEVRATEARSWPPECAPAATRPATGVPSSPEAGRTTQGPAPHVAGPGREASPLTGHLASRPPTSTAGTVGTAGRGEWAVASRAPFHEEPE